MAAPDIARGATLIFEAVRGLIRLPLPGMVHLQRG
jgi:hypothetical protein